MAARHILVTGFEPFAGDTANPSQELAKAMDGRVVADHAVRSLVLPVQHEAAGEIMRGALDAAGLAAVIHLGLAAGRARLSLERIAVNVMDYRIPDARGEVRRDEPCVPDGPRVREHAAAAAILEELTADGIPAHLSYTAGTYLCNYTLYTTLHALALPAARSPPASSTSRSARHGRGARARGAEHGSGVMVRALETVLRVITTALRVQSRHVRPAHTPSLHLGRLPRDRRGRA
jgi:pyroglutamyl-peptidase